MINFFFNNISDKFKFEPTSKDMAPFLSVLNNVLIASETIFLIVSLPLFKNGTIKCTIFLEKLKY